MNTDTSRYQKFADLAEAIREWIRFGRKGTRPRKVRANSNLSKRASRSKRVARDRKKSAMTKAIQRVRTSRGQQIRTGK